MMFVNQRWILQKQLNSSVGIRVRRIL